MVGGHSVVTVLIRHVLASWTVRPKIPCAVWKTLSLIGLQRPNCKFPTFTSYAPPAQQEMPPTFLLLPSAGSTALHLVFDLMGFTTRLAHEIIQQGDHIFLWVPGDAPPLITTKPTPLLNRLGLYGVSSSGPWSQTPPNIQSGNSANVAVATRWMGMSH